MDGLLQQLRDLLGGVGANPAVALALRIGAAYFVVLWLACVLWTFVDMRRRSGSLVAPYVSAAVVVLASPFLFPLAILLHVIVRPKIPVADRRLEVLRDSALAAEIDLSGCPICRRPIDDEWLICPACRTALGHRCEGCGHTAPIDWDVCAWCGTPFGPPRATMRTAR
jgi:hypothetical protein